jgi:acetyltransferase-like isoleucine patch superfamily enzyme
MIKQCAKRIADGIALVLVAPVVLVYWGLCVLVGTRRTFPGCSKAFSLIPGTIGVYLRRAFYRLTLSRCDAGCWIGFGTVLSHSTAAIGRNAYLGVFCCLGDVTLEDDVLLGSHVSIMNGSAQHGIDRLDVPIREQPGVWPRVTIGEDTWIGDRAIVMANVGAHCVIGAGSVVTKPIPDYAIAVGVPAKVVRYRRGAPAGDGTAQELEPATVV